MPVVGLCMPVVPHLKGGPRIASFSTSSPRDSPPGPQGQLLLPAARLRAISVGAKEPLSAAVPGHQAVGLTRFQTFTSQRYQYHCTIEIPSGNLT